DILKSEVAAHLDVIGDYLDRCAEQPVVASEALLRAVHTLNGAIAMVDIPALGHVLAPLEGYIKRLRGIGAAPDGGGVDAWEETISLAREVVARLDMGIGALPDSSNLVARVVALRDVLPEPETSLHLYTGTEPAQTEIADAIVAEAAEEIAVAAENSEPEIRHVFAADDITAHHLTPAVADDDLTSSWVQSLDESEREGVEEIVTGEVPA